jgi:hypothetical protein
MISKSSTLLRSQVENFRQSTYVLLRSTHNCALLYRTTLYSTVRNRTVLLRRLAELRLYLDFSPIAISKLFELRLVNKAKHWVASLSAHSSVTDPPRNHIYVPPAIRYPPVTHNECYWIRVSLLIRCVTLSYTFWSITCLDKVPFGVCTTGNLGPKHASIAKTRRSR